MTIYTSDFPSVPVVQESIFTFLLSTTFHNFPPNSTAFIEAATGLTITRQQLRDFSLQLGWGLRHEFTTLGGVPLKRGDIVMIFSPNSIAWPVMMFGCFAAGIKPTMANSAYTWRELEYQWKDSTASAMLVHPSLLGVALEFFEKGLGWSEAEVKKRVILADWAPPPAEKKSGGGYVHMGDLLGKGSLKEEEKFDGDLANETTVLLYSSGTTGKAKGVETTHQNLTSEIQILDPAFPKTVPNECLLAVLPFYHIYGAINLLMYPFSNGIPVCIQPKFDPVEFCRAIERYGITMCFAVPPIFIALIRHPAPTQFNMKTLRFLSSGAAPLGVPLTMALKKRLESVGSKAWICQGYGSTETSPASHLMNVEDCYRKAGSCGKLLANLEARLVSEDGKDVKEGERGELWLRGPIVMKGYLNNPTSTKNTVTEDGWYKTGDVSTIDKEGYYYIVDRVKELIKYKGFQVPPAELESILLQHPSIADCAVIGIWSEKEATELPRAYIVHAQGRSSINHLTFSKEIQKWIQSRVARHKFLRGGVSVIDAIPKSAAGKILRKDLRELAKKEVLEEDVKARL